MQWQWFSRCTSQPAALSLDMTFWRTLGPLGHQLSDRSLPLQLGPAPNLFAPKLWDSLKIRAFPGYVVTYKVLAKGSESIIKYGKYYFKNQRGSSSIVSFFMVDDTSAGSYILFYKEYPDISNNIRPLESSPTWQAPGLPEISSSILWNSMSCWGIYLFIFSYSLD